MKGNIQPLPGSPLPLGVQLTPQGINFAIFSRHADSVALVVTLPGEHEQAPLIFPLDPAMHKTGDVWHILLQGAPPGLRYGYRMIGPNDPQGSGHFYNGRDILLDPYARALASGAWGEKRPYLGSEPCCLIDHEPYDWEGDRPLKTPIQDTIIYELHVRGFTRHPSAQVAHPGTFRGLIEKIDYLRKLGITAIELLPVTEFDENEALFFNPTTGDPLKNYWGYSPLLFGAPKASYSSNPITVLHEFRDMVKAFHRAGIEVYLDVVFNHSAEGGQDGHTTSFRGIDNTIYYLLDPWTKAYLNYSGCGNTCNCNHPITRKLILDMLRWWVVEMHVDGFRFDLASILSRGLDGSVLANPPVVEILAEDPVLSDAKIIAEAWDAGGLYQVGNFSTYRRWAEWNGRFRDDVRSFMCGHPGQVPALATRIAGSSDLYRTHGRSPCNSINFITSHDGFTLADLVSYNHKHNLANGEQNRDGDNNNISWNSGAEGTTTNPAILALRQRRVRSFAVILLLSHGVPMLAAGDEFGRSQGGNNNAWSQDNSTSWIDWSLADKNKDLLRFFSMLIRLRRNHRIFRRTTFYQQEGESKYQTASPDICWYGQNDRKPDWSSESRTLAFLLKGTSVPLTPEDDFFVMLNGSTNTPAVFTVPAPPDKERRWVRIIDTTAPSPLDINLAEQGMSVLTGQNLRIAPMGCMVLQAILRKRPI
ncbi:MAG: glycogen debranching protein GlgX [Desulfobulbaceae bacterium]|nr:glycogen debranching protein GlgX [Desulfobulbaceae bacterium]